jgi:hypothetical protein
MALNLDPADLSTALQNLSATEKGELLRLLQERDRLESEQTRRDDEAPWDDLIEKACERAAAASGDPAAWRVAHEAHDAARQGHYRLLVNIHYKSLTEDETAEDFLSSRSVMWAEATRLATADGFAPANDVVKPRAAELREEVSSARFRRATLPPEVRADIEATETCRAEQAVYSRIASAAQDDDKLFPCRDKSGGAANPSSYEDD